MPSRLGLSLIVSLLVSVAATARAGDWPMWRHDAARSAASQESLPAELHPVWSQHYGPRRQVWDDPLNNDLMPYDKVFEPVVADGRMFVAFNDRDKLVALDAATGKQLWQFFTDGPLRLPPVASGGNVYFASDDGFLYCLAAADGTLRWRFRGGPSGRKVLGNRRVISAWPARGGPVVKDGRIYFAAGIWPFMGTFIYGLDAETGDVVWVNDHTGSDYVLQPHNALSFAGVAPQGALAVAGDLLLVPGGRSVPAAFDRTTGELRYFPLAAGGKGSGGSLVIAGESEYYVHTRQRGVRAFDLANGKGTKYEMNEPVVDGEFVYTAGVDKTGPVVVAIDSRKKLRWAVSADGGGDLIKAGDRLYAAGGGEITAIDLPKDGSKAAVAWSMPVEGEVLRLLAADQKLFAVTLDGRILAFGERNGGENGAGKGKGDSPISVAGELGQSPDAIAEARSILNAAGTKEGYALVFGVDDGRLLAALAAESQLHLVAVDPDGEKVARLRADLDAAGLYGVRVAVHQGDPDSFQAPPYIANLVVVGRSLAAGIDDPATLARIYASVRPYGGTLYLSADADETARLSALAGRANLEGAKITPAGDHLVVVRQGPLAGAGQWTHQYGDVANTVKSNDRRVKLPLGVLWFGGPSNLDVLPRHGHGPPEQVVGGRLFIEGMNCLSARDVYTGRVFWKVGFPGAGLGNFGIYFDDSYADTPLSTSYNQKHIPGAAARGTNFVATADKVYVVLGDKCRVLDAVTGATLTEIPLPDDGQTERQTWGYIGVYGDLLLGGVDMDDDGERSIEEASASRRLVVFDRNTGKVLWQADARHSFLHNGIVAGGGRVYCLDRLRPAAEKKLARRGETEKPEADAEAATPAPYRIVAFDAQSGKTLWQVDQDVFGTWLGYSEEHDVLLQAGDKGRDRLADEVGHGMAVYRAGDGSVLWKNLELQYSGPCVLHHETIYTNADGPTKDGSGDSKAVGLLDGSLQSVVNPITGVSEPWRMSRGYGCGSITASENLLFMRSGAAAFFDLQQPGGVGNFGGFKSGCTSNLVAADGVLNAPDYTRTCSCAYQNQTSLALIPMPDVEVWTTSRFADKRSAEGRIERVGLNLGAPGDRQSSEGTLWVEYPTQPDAPPLGIAVSVTGPEAEYFRHNALTVSGPLAWVAASGVRNVASVSVDLDGGDHGGSTDAGKAAAYTVRLYFAEPDSLAPGQRVFDVLLQGKKVLDRFDVAKEAGGPDRSVVREFPNVSADDTLRIDFAAAEGAERGPILSGVEIIAQ